MSRKIRKSRKTSWEPCVLCGTPDGRITGTSATPARIDLARYGLALGKACDACAGKVRHRHRKGLPLLDWLTAKELPPCTICGTTEGRRNSSSRRPARSSLATLGMEGKACKRCHKRLRYRQNAGIPLLDPVVIGGLKLSYDPCAACGEAEGLVMRRCKTPVRCRLSRFAAGDERKVCFHCYNKIRHLISRGVPFPMALSRISIRPSPDASSPT